MADVQITEQAGGQLPGGMKTGTGDEPGVYQTRLAADVHQKKMDEAEATPLLLALAPAFTQPTFGRFTTLLAAAVLTTGRRTVANLLRTAGLSP